MKGGQRSKRAPGGGRQAAGQGVVVRRTRDEGLSWDQERIGREEQEGERRAIGRRVKSLSAVGT